MAQPPQAIVMQILPASPAGSVVGMNTPPQMLPGVLSATNTAPVNSPTPIGSPVVPAGVPNLANASPIPTPAATGAGIIPPQNKQIRILVWHYLRKVWKILLQSLKVIGGVVAIICGIWALSLAYWSATQQLKQSCMNDKMLNLTTTPACEVALSTPTKHFKRLVRDVTPPITQASYIAMSTPVRYLKHLLYEDEQFLPAMKKLLHISYGLWAAFRLHQNLDNAQNWIRGAMKESSIGTIVLPYLLYSCLPAEQEKELAKQSVKDRLSGTWPDTTELVLLTLLMLVLSIRNSLHVFGPNSGRRALIILICIIAALTIDILFDLNMASGSSWLPCTVLFSEVMLLEPEVTLGTSLLYESPNGDLFYAATSKDENLIVKGHDGKWTLLNQPNSGRFIHWKLDKRLFQESKAVIDGQIASYPKDQSYEQELKVRASQEWKIQLAKTGFCILILGIVMLIGAYGDNLWDKLRGKLLAIHARL